MHQRIRAWRTHAGLNQKQLADACEVSPAAVSQWEDGQTHPRPENVASILRAVKCDSLEQFYGEVPVEEPSAA